MDRHLLDRDRSVMTDPRTCPLCGEILLADAPDGLCPACLMKSALSDESMPDLPAPAPESPGAGPGADLTCDWPPDHPHRERTDRPGEPRAEPAGEQHFGDYELLRVLGRGGMGIV